MFNIGVYANGLRLGPELVSLNEDLDLTVISNRPDKVYHLVLSESTNLRRMDIKWDPILIKYRYFFPLTIERNIQHLINKRYLYIAYDNSVLTLIDKLESTGRLKSILTTLIELEEDTNQIYSYTQNASQLADYLTYTKSSRKNYVLPTGTDPVSNLVKEYYATKASVDGRSLFVAFIEQCLIAGHLTLDTIPKQYIEPNQAVYPYYSGQGGYYGFNTPLRVLSYTINPKRHS